jgi:hypothetical protein
MIGNLPPQTVLTLVLTVLQAHFQRQADQLQEMQSGLAELHTEKLTTLWQQLLDKQPPEKALTWFTQWILAELDGGLITVEEGDLLS